MDTSTSPACPACGGELILQRISDLNVVEYRARCPGCQWAGWLRELPCGGCHERRLFEWTGGAWRCLLCSHVRGDQSPPRALPRYGPSWTGGPQPDGAETPPRRGPCGRGEAVGRILEAIPCDGWVSAAEIAAETGISSRKVAGTIRRSLLGADVERKSTRSFGRGRYLYRRLRYVDASRGIPDSWRGPAADAADTPNGVSGLPTQTPHLQDGRMDSGPATPSGARRDHRGGPMPPKPRNASAPQHRDERPWLEAPRASRGRRSGGDPGPGAGILMAPSSAHLARGPGPPHSYTGP